MTGRHLSGNEAMLAFPAAARGAVCSPAVSRTMRIAVLALLLISALVATAAVIAAVGSDPARPEIVDFHAFYLAGRMAWDRHFADSYDVPLMQALQRSFGGGTDAFMPFVYPPSFGLVLAPLARLPVGLAYVLFTGTTLAFYLAVLRRISGAWFWQVLLTVSPALIINIRLGQNGFLTAGLAALAAELLASRHEIRAGLLTGLLAFKPQIATMLPMLFGLRRTWRGIGVAAATAILVTGSAVLILGRETVPAFLASTAVVADFMAAGTFPLHRMTSVYAFAISLGAPARVALAIHGLVAVPVVIAATVTANRLGGGPLSTRSRSEVRTASGVLLMATAFVSPYFFDYDLTVFGAGLALALPSLARRMSARSLAVFLTAVGATGAMGLWTNELIGFGMMPPLSLGAPPLLACFGVVLVSLDGLRSVAVRDAAA